ncbi:MAG: chloride channel protein [Nitrospirota bacterium]
MKKKLDAFLLFLAKIRADEQTALIILSLAIGMLAGVANIVFRTSMEFVRATLFVGGSKLLHINEGGAYRALLPLIPMAGALLLIPFSLLFPGEVNGYGFSKFIETVNIRGGIIKVRNIFLKIIGPALTIGSGGSAGVEGPIAIIGGTIGSGVGQAFRLSGNRMKLLIAAGSAGAIAATFNAPIAGIMFAMEVVLLGNYELSSFAAIVISSGIATFVSRGYYGANPAFTVPQYDLVSAAEIPLYLLLGLIIGIIAIVYIRVFHQVKDEFASIKMPFQAKPVLGALIVGSIGIFFPHVMGNGYEYIEEALSGQIIFPVIALLIFLKIIATSVTLGSGGAGGVFAPALFIGAVTGGSFGSIVHKFFPAVTAYPGAYATVGIGAFLAAATHAPLTGIFLLFEMTGNYKIIIPLLFASVVGTIVAKRLCHDSIDTVELTQKGIALHLGMERSVMDKIKVKDIMRQEFIQVKWNTILKEVITIMVENKRFYVPVTDDNGNMLGIVSIQDIRHVLFEEKVKEKVTVDQIITEQVITLFPDDDLNTAMRKFSLKDIDELPVVDTKEPRRVLAMLGRGDVISAYNREVLREKVQ